MIVFLQVYVDDDVAVERVNVTTASQEYNATIADLKPGHTYNISVVAVSGDVHGNISSIINFTSN